ncbi:MAG TPA: cation:proton antiporter, partial [Hyphomicrobiales bacterium]|nr:cation:proton antiporter [Hyphomicrobiales bacterium]
MEISVEAMAAGILLFGFVSQVLAWWLKLPAILFLLLIGLLAGPTTGLLDPDALLGELMFPVISLSVAVILFEGSLTLRLDEIRAVGGVIQRLVSLGALAAWGIIAAITHWAMGFSWEIAAMMP